MKCHSLPISGRPYARGDLHPEIVVPSSLETISRNVVNRDLLCSPNGYCVGVVEVTPWHLNERLTVQQGLFLFPREFTRGFEFHLCRTINNSDALPRRRRRTVDAVVKLLKKKRPAVLKIVIPPRLWCEIMHDLRQMNVTAASLYPGVDGLARSLKFHAAGYRAMDALVEEAGDR